MNDPQPISTVTLKSDGPPTSSIILLLEPRDEYEAQEGAQDSDLYITTSLDLRYENGARWRFQVSETHAFALDEIEEFENELTALEESRHGIATLSCKVVGDFDLFIESTDDAGHMIARVSFITRADAGLHRNLHFDNPVSYAFEIDPGRLPRFVRDFRAFVAECAL